MADLWSRPGALTFSVALFTVGVILVAAAQNITTVCVGLVIYTLGNSGVSFRMSPCSLTRDTCRVADE
jgi:predicted MFS family arabinose efflux permease